MRQCGFLLLSRTAPWWKAERALGAFAVLSLATISCGSSERPLPVDVEPSPDFYLTLGPVLPQVFLAVVDDSPEASELRTTMARTFAELDAHVEGHSASCLPPFDPAAEAPTHRTVVVAHPSGLGPARYTSEVDLPALRWVTEARTDAELDAWASAVARALEPKPGASGPFAALAVHERALSLLTGLRDAESDDEAAILTALPPSYQTVLVAALGREDESPGESASYVVPLGGTSQGPIVLPSSTPTVAPASCYDWDVTSTARYESWVDAQGLSSPAHWPCADGTFWPEFFADCRPSYCFEQAPTTDADGTTDCTVLVTTLDESPCDPQYGWFDPVSSSGERKPRVVRDEQGVHRVCEIRQLEGAALESCVTSLECADCEPGWCATRVPELLVGCGDERANRVRFVLGANRAAHGTAAVTCER